MKKLLSATIVLLLISISFTTFSQEKEDTDKPSKPEKVTKVQAMQAAESARSARSAGSASSSSQLSLRKSFDGESKKNNGSFDVDNSVRNISLMFGGSVKEGKITIKILLPDGKTFKDLTIDESADMQFSQNIKIAKDTEKYYGDWKYVVESTKAVGHYNLNINTR